MATGTKAPKKYLSRRRAQSQLEQADQEQRLLNLRRRITLAGQGVEAYQGKRLAEAVRAFRTYIGILEDWKRVEPGNLHPENFDTKKDLPEMVLISGVYWDLAKIYDRARNDAREKLFRHYLEKYVLFAKGMPYQPLCAETLRKYIGNKKPVHRDDFKNAYKVMTGSPCFVATSLIDVCDLETLPRLRRFRGEVLMPSRSGRAFVRWYYRAGPRIAAWLDRMPEFVRRGVARGLDLLAKMAANLAGDEALR